MYQMLHKPNRRQHKEAECFNKKSKRHIQLLAPKGEFQILQKSRDCSQLTLAPKGKSAEHPRRRESLDREAESDTNVTGLARALSLCLQSTQGHCFSLGWISPAYLLANVGK